MKIFHRSTIGGEVFCIFELPRKNRRFIVLKDPFETATHECKLIVEYFKREISQSDRDEGGALKFRTESKLCH